jgi:putative endonuclease
MRDTQDGWSVYLLRCADGTLYCGCTNDVDRRLAAHARGRVKYTRGRLPVELAHVESAGDRSAALRSEAAWKRLPRAEKLRRMSKAERPVRLTATCASAANSLSPGDVENCSPKPKPKRKPAPARMR